MRQATARAAEPARIPGADIGVVAYHLRKLNPPGLCEPANETRVRVDAFSNTSAIVWPASVVARR